ncbi:hypothetical protein [Absidia glauca]|uniref:Uncharacterized protein n=1 Tax=Absidia glauca TaxID=4829 RepID=A0A168MLC3_ABSGL|nr:hypothetical protein [Absidia glauca]
MTIYVDPSTQSEAAIESPKMPINANRCRRSTAKGKAICKESTPILSPWSEDPKRDSNLFKVLKQRQNTEGSDRFTLRHRVKELEKEIKWLRERIVEKKKKDDRLQKSSKPQSGLDNFHLFNVSYPISSFSYPSGLSYQALVRPKDANTVVQTPPSVEVDTKSSGLGAPDELHR